MTEPSFVLLILIVGLVFAAGALARATAAIWELISQLLVALFANLRALAIITLLIACVVIVALLGGPPAAGGIS